jgi:hypothetical protein
MQIISRAKLIDELVMMYDIAAYGQLAEIHKIIDSIVGKGVDEIAVKDTSKIIAKTDKLFKMRAK